MLLTAIISEMCAYLMRRDLSRKPDGSITVGIIRWVEIRRSAQFSAEIRRSSDF